MQDKQNFCPNKISSYFRAEWLSLTFVTLSGLFYNVGLLSLIHISEPTRRS